MREDLSDSSEDLYSLSTTTTDLFNFSPSESYIDSGYFAPARNSVSRLSFIASFFKTLFVTFSLAILEIVHFAFSLIKYLNLKVLRLVRFLDVSKDKLVDTLMWRRGLLFRPATHGGVIVVTAIAILAGGLFSRGQIAAQDLTASESILRPTNTVKTIVPTDRPRSEVITYKVESGDTLSTVAEKYQVSTESIKWANGMNADNLHPGQELKVPPVTGVVHQVKAGDTLASVAKAYSADAQTIADFPFNYVDDTLEVRPGQTLFVPNGTIPAPVAPKVSPRTPVQTGTFVVGSGRLSWPIAKRINQGFSWYHPGIDIGAAHGTPIYAAAAGTVVDAKKQTYSFGWYCIIDIGGGMTVAYAHMSDLACSMGQSIARGQYIGAVGMTGRATGPHLHFEVRQGGKAVNPLSLLN